MPYRYQTRFTKNILSGTLQGLAISTTLPHVSKRAAEQHVEFLNTITKKAPKRDCITGTAWYPSHITIEPYSPTTSAP